MEMDMTTEKLYDSFIPQMVYKGAAEIGRN